jgi:hypothetical protein
MRDWYRLVFFLILASWLVAGCSSAPEEAFVAGPNQVLMEVPGMT